MYDKNWQQRWVENNPLLWKLMNKVLDLVWFLIKVEICLIILELLGGG